MSAVDKLLEEKIILVVGGGSGIGRAIALKCAYAGGKVYVSGRRASALEETVKKGMEGGVTINSYPFDASDPKRVKEAVKYIIQENERLDAMVLSVGPAIAGGLTETDFNDWKLMQQNHLDTIFLCCKESLEGLRKSTAGNILIIGSIFGLRGKENRLAYCTVKGAVVNYVRALALDLAGSIRVNSICPGWVATEMSMKLVNAAANPDSAILERHNWHPMGRGGTVEEVADLALYMLSDQAGWLTGQNIALDGGYTAR